LIGGRADFSTMRGADDLDAVAAGLGVAGRHRPAQRTLASSSASRSTVSSVVSAPVSAGPPAATAAIGFGSRGRDQRLGAQMPSRQRSAQRRTDHR
jgi:hypothetical protein